MQWHPRINCRIRQTAGYLKKAASLLFLAVILCLSPAVPGQGICGSAEEQLDFLLPVPENESHRNYLGLSGQDSFLLGSIQTDILIIEIFSMYCPICQREAPFVNELYESMLEYKGKHRIKLIGIGSGNSDFEVSFFKDKYNIRFPMFSDADFSIHKKIGEVRTPHFFGLKIEKDGSFKVFYSKSGTHGDPARFLNLILESAGSQD